MSKKIVSIILALILVLGCCSSAFAATSWDAPKGGTWTLTKFTIPSPGISYLRPDKVVYITYDELALIQANKLTTSDLSSIATIARDYGVKKAAEYLTKKFGTKVAEKFVPYLGNAVVAYDVFNALVSFCEDKAYADCIKHKKGVRIETGLQYSMGTVQSKYKAISEWDGGKVTNPANCTGTFTSN